MKKKEYLTKLLGDDNSDKISAEEYDAGVQSVDMFTNDESEEKEEETESSPCMDDEDDFHYTSSTYYDYSPSCPWNAPGMSVRDFI